VIYQDTARSRFFWIASLTSVHVHSCRFDLKNTETGAVAQVATAPVTTTNQLLKRFGSFGIELLNVNVDKLDFFVGSKFAREQNPGLGT